MAGRVPEVAEILKCVGTVSVSNDIVAAKWMKLVVNCMSLGPVAMLGITVGEAIAMPGFRDFILRAGSEALSVGRDRKYAVQPIFGLTPEDIGNRLLETLFDKLASDIGPGARDCVLQDHLKGRYSEVDMINGMVSEESRRAGRRAPANAAVTEITRRIRNEELAPERSNLELALKLAAG